MKKKLKVFLYFFVISFCSFFGVSCAGQNSVVSHIVQDQENKTATESIIEAVDILETQDGFGVSTLPNWLLSYINGGIEELEKTDLLQNKYFFISMNEGINLSALSKWANNYSSAHDFPRLVSARIEERVISAAVLYPDSEYGVFFEVLVKMALGSEYPEAVKEDTYWIKIVNREEVEYQEIYKFYVILSIDKAVLQTKINKVMAEALSAVNPTRAQNTAISRLQQSFFEGF